MSTGAGEWKSAQRVDHPHPDKVQRLLFVNVVQRFARNNVRPAAMHLQGAYSSHDNRRLGDQARVATFYVKEFLHSNVRSEACFCYAVAIL